jgi:acetyl esterase
MLGAAPAILYFHGGGWVAGSLDSHDGLCRALANRAAAPLISVDYRLAPECPFPAALDDSLLAANWLEQMSGELGASSDRLSVAGDSAGGNLASALCLRRKELGLRQPSAQVLIYPAMDPSCEACSHREAGQDYFFTTEAMRWCWSHYVADSDDLKNPLVAPVKSTNLSGLAPALVITAQFDPLHDEGEAYAGMLRAHGVPTMIERYDGQVHGFLIWDRHVRRAGEARDRIGAWLGAVRG